MKPYTLVFAFLLMAVPSMASDKDSKSADKQEISTQVEKKHEEAEKVVFVVSKKDQEEDSDY